MGGSLACMVRASKVGAETGAINPTYAMARGINPAPWQVSQAYRK